LNKYEGLFILDFAGKDEEAKDIIQKIQNEIEAAGGRVEKVQRMGQRPFARTTRRRSAGYYVNFLFQAPPRAIAALDAKFHLEPQIFRWQITHPQTEPPARRPAAATAAAKE
jgi:ribosomal protein S6